jgi:hypothetical protein
MSDMLEEADIELDLDFGNYIVMGKKPQDVSDKTFQNLFITPRTSNKELSMYASKTKDSKVKVDNKSIARANAYDGPDLTLQNMIDNYEKNVGKKGTVYRTNLVQPGNFSLEGNRRLNHPIVAVQSMSGPEALEAFSGKKKKHYYGLDMQFVGPVRMDKITSRNKDGTVPQPNLRPATVGNITLGNEIGEVKVSGNMHVLYDYIEVDGSMSLADEILRLPKFNEGGLVLPEGGTVELVGTPTGETTTAGRPIYRTKEGKDVSEISTTFKYKGKWINIPTIHNGYVRDQGELILMLDHDVIKPTSTHKSEAAAVKAAEDRSPTLKGLMSR